MSAKRIKNARAVRATKRKDARKRHDEESTSEESEQATIGQDTTTTEHIEKGPSVAISTMTTMIPEPFLANDPLNADKSETDADRRKGRTDDEHQNKPDDRKGNSTVPTPERTTQEPEIQEKVTAIPSPTPAKQRPAPAAPVAAQAETPPRTAETKAAAIPSADPPTKPTAKTGGAIAGTGTGADRAIVDVPSAAGARTASLIAIDWENIRRSAGAYNTAISPRELTEALVRVGRLFGPTIGGTAFGDWTLRPMDAEAFLKAGMNAYNVPRSTAGKDRTDPSVMLEVHDWLREREDCGFIILASGDSDYEALVRRAKQGNRRVIICAFSKSIARDLLNTAPVFPLEAELGIEDPGSPQYGEMQANGDSRLLPIFIQKMDHFERQLQFVGYNRLSSQWMIQWGVAIDEYQSCTLLQTWIKKDIIERHDALTPNSKGAYTPAVRLVRTNLTVKEALLQGNGDARTPACPHAKTA